MNRYVGFVLLFASSVALGQGMTKWVDEQGRVHYGDRPPPNAKEQNIAKGTVSSVRSQGGSPQRSSRTSTGSGGPQDVKSYNDEVARKNMEIDRRNREIEQHNKRVTSRR